MCSCKKDEKETSNEPAVVTEEPTKEVEEVKPHTTNYSENEITEKVTIVVDGKEITPTDNNGEAVETIIHDGVVYLPVKTVADATGRAFHWDGPSYTAYLGDMDGTLEYPTKKMEDMTSINHTATSTERLTDNYGNKYSRAIYNAPNDYQFEYLLNMKYSKFKATLYVPEGETDENVRYLTITADGNTIYTSPEMTRASAPVEIDVDVTGYNDVKIEFNASNTNMASFHKLEVCLGDAGFYQ